MIEYREKYIDTLPVNTRSRNYLFSSTVNKLFISLLIEMDNKSYRALYQYDENGYKYIRAINGAMLEITDDNGVAWLYTDDLNKKIRMDDIYSKPVEENKMEEIEVYYGIDSLQNIILFNDTIHIFSDTRHIMVNKSLDMSSVVIEDLPIDDGYERVFIENKLGLCIYNNKLRIHGLCKSKNEVYTFQTYEWDETNGFVEVYDGIDYIGGFYPNNFCSIVFQDNLYLFNSSTGMYILEYDSYEEYFTTVTKNRTDYKLSGIPEFAWVYNNELHAIYDNDYISDDIDYNMNHYIVSRNVTLGKCICKFPTKTEVDPIKDRSSGTNRIYDKYTNIKLSGGSQSESGYYRKLKDLDIDSTITSHSTIGECIGDRYLVLFNEVGLYVYDLYTDKLIKKTTDIKCNDVNTTSILVGSNDSIYDFSIFIADIENNKLQWIRNENKDIYSEKESFNLTKTELSLSDYLDDDNVTFKRVIKVIRVFDKALNKKINLCVISETWVASGKGNGTGTGVYEIDEKTNTLKRRYWIHSNISDEADCDSIYMISDGESIYTFFKNIDSNFSCIKIKSENGIIQYEQTKYSIFDDSNAITIKYRHIFYFKNYIHNLCIHEMIDENNLNCLSFNMEYNLEEVNFMIYPKDVVDGLVIPGKDKAFYLLPDGQLYDTYHKYIRYNIEEE